MGIIEALKRFKTKGYNVEKMTAQRAQEIAESFVNGNILWVKERTRSSRAFIAVRAELPPDSLESYDRICGS